MTPESIQAANEIDTFPPDLRKRLRDAVFRIADVYRATSEAGWPPRNRAAPEPVPEPLPEGVVRLSDRRRPRAG